MKRSGLRVTALSLFLLIAGCGGGGGGETSADAIITRSSEAKLDPDASILAAREVGGFVVPLTMAQTLSNELKRVRGAFPETVGVHAYAFYNPHELHFALDASAPWLAKWKAGQLSTGVAEIDDLLKSFGAQAVRYLSDEGDQVWFVVTFDTYLRAHRAAGLFVGKSAALRIASIVEPTAALTSTDIQYELTADVPPITRLTFIQAGGETSFEKNSVGVWQKKPAL